MSSPPAAAVAPARAPLAPVRVSQTVVAILVLVKVYLTFAMPPLGDEAYYWMWGQKLGWSYFDHPPLQAWLLGLMSVFGWGNFSLRLLTWLTFGGTLWIFWLWSRRLKPDDPGAWFWPATALYLSAPLFLLMGSIAFPDHLLIFLCLLAAHLFLVFAEKWEATGRGFGWLYAGAAALGLAVLTKYNGVLIGIAVAAFFALRPQTRPLWRSPHLYLAALLAVAMQAPVFYWNLTEGFASYRFHLSERWAGATVFRLNHLTDFLALAVLLLSPFLLLPLFGMFRRPLGASFADRTRQLALSAAVVSTLSIAAISLFVETYFYWNITAFVLAMPLLVGWIRRPWVLYGHFAYGLVFAGLLAFNSTVIPLQTLAGKMPWDQASAFGWPEVAARIAVLRAQYPTKFIATTRYSTAAQLGFALHDAEVTAISPRPDQYDFWFDAAAHLGEDALVVSDPQLGLSGIADHFDSLTPLESLDIAWDGHTIYRPQLYLGRGYH